MQILIKDPVTAALDQVGAKIRDRTPIAEAVGLTVSSLAARSFNDPSVRASPWAPLKPATLREKIAAGQSTAILKRSTLLFRSWRVIEATADRVRVGSDRFYAIFHQFGTKRGLPARPMLPITGGVDNARLTDLAVRRVVDAARAALAALLG